MKRLNLVLVALLFITAIHVNAQSETKNWSNDPAHSQLHFTVTHLGFNDISGTFDQVAINVNTSKSDLSDASIELTAETNSINTLVEARDNHLKSADFFDAEKFPTITFKSTGLEKVSEGTYKLNGNLTMHGITKSVVLDLIYKGETVNPMSSKKTIAFKVTGTLNRSDFAVGDKFPEAIISDEVRIAFNGEFVQPKE